MALANHRKTIRSELAAYAERFREMQIAALSSTLEGYGFESTDVPPLAVLVLLDSIGRLIVMEESMGMRTGLQETMDLVERYLDRFEGPPEAREAPADPRPPPPQHHPREVMRH